ncbi:MAG: hypothetical protein ACQGVK_21190 [Myxococcota bacterium]
MSRPTAWIVWVVAAAALTGLGVSRCNSQLELVQEQLQIPGAVEAHTPGSGLPEEMAVSDPIRQILGDDVDLNHVDYVRTAVVGADEPDIVMILIPGFLGGAGTFDPVARDLVRKLGGKLEVWAVNRRSQQLEDRRGALHARSGAEAGLAATDPAAVEQAVQEGVRFYFPGSDTDFDGVPDAPFPLPDAIPGDGDSDFQMLAQDDLRFAAHWGVDTYVRDWRELVLAARALVGDDGLVLFGGHSMGTTWTGVFAAYDFDAGPGVEAGFELVDGLILWEGGGTGPPSANAPDLATYEATVALLETPGGPDVFLQDLFGFVDAVEIGAAGELNGVAGRFLPDAPSVMQQTPLFGGIPVNILLQAPMTNRSLPGFFLDDDFSTNAAFSASMGFSDNGSNVFNPIGFLVPGSFYLALAEGTTRVWKNFDDPDLPSCPPELPPPFPSSTDLGESGCAIIDNGPRPGPGEPPAQWGLEREVTDIDVLIRTLYETGNASEWYFVSGRPSLDLSFGRDSSALGAPELLNVTQHANVDVPILAIGGSNGLAPTEQSFAGYLDSTSSSDTSVVILEGYSHLDPLSASDNEAVAPTVDWMTRLLVQKQIAGAP